MRNVKRTGEPPSLALNAKRWTAALLTRIRSGRKVSTSLANRYRQRDVLDALTKMYSGLCCYCESEISIVAFEHIEHLRPKSKYPQHRFQWQNLHLACPKCNIAKGNQFNERHPILDPAAGEPIERHLIYATDAYGVWVVPKSVRGRTTESHTTLNRKELLEARRKIFAAAVDLITKINGNPRAHDVDVQLQHLEEMCHGPYGTVIRFAMGKLLRRQQR